MNLSIAASGQFHTEKQNSMSELDNALCVYQANVTYKYASFK